MLSFADKLDLIDALCMTAEAMGAILSPNAAKMMADDLERFTVNDLVNALTACRQETTGRLSLAAIIQRVQAADGRPGKDEAWSIALSGSDESETVVMTTEIQQAITASAPILALGDKVGARMAFISSYERLVTLARAEAQPVKWTVSLGFDAGRRVRAIESAERMQLITSQQAAGYLADLRVTPITQDGLAIAGLITGNVYEASPKVRQKIAEVKSIVQAAKAKQDRLRAKKAQQDRVNTYLRKRAMRKLIAAEQAKRAAQ